MSNNIATTIEVLRIKDIKKYDLVALRVHVGQLHSYLPAPHALTAWALDSLADARLSHHAPHLRAERDTARKEQDEFMAADVTPYRLCNPHHLPLKGILQCL